MKRSWILGLAVCAVLGAACVGGAAEIQNSLLRVRYEGAAGTFSVQDAAGRAFLLDARVRGGNAEVATGPVGALGQGPVLTVRDASGAGTRLMLVEGVPFLFVQPLLHNAGSAVTNIAAVEAFSATADVGVAAGAAVSWGTAGLKAVDKHPGSYAFLALADPATRKGVVAAWLTHDRGSGIVFSGRDGDRASLRAKTDYGRLLLGAGQEAAGEILAVGWFDDVRVGLEQWADLIARQYAIKLPPQPDGYCTWYSNPHGGAADENSIIELSQCAARELKPYGFDFVQIDDCWQEGKRRNGPAKVFLEHNPAGPYPNGMKPVADKIRELGLIPGLWFMPFAGDKDDPWFANKQEWFAKDSSGKPYDTPWGGAALDQTHPQVQAYLCDVVDRIAHEWGYGYFKMDGMWMGTATKQIYVNNGYRGDDDLGSQKVFNPKMTPIEAYRNGLKLIRRAAGKDVFILGCCVSQNMRSFGGTFGLVDAMRIGPDNGGNWDSIKVGPWHGGNRYFLHGRVWYNDPDPLYIRASMPFEQAQAICSWVGLSGMLQASSDWLPAAAPERINLLKRVLPSHGLHARPADILENEMAQVWRLDAPRATGPFHVLGIFNWDDGKPLSVVRPLARCDLDPSVTYVGFDYWANRFVPPLTGDLRADLPPASCRILALRPAANHPQVVSTSRHITQGAVDLVSETWDAEKGELRGVSRLLVHGERYELRIIVPEGPSSWRLSTVQSKTLVDCKQDGPLVRVALVPERDGEVQWRVGFARGEVKALTAAKPSNLKAETAWRKVRLSWSASEASLYRVQREDGAAWTVGEPSLSDLVEPGSRHTYSVQARGWSEAWSDAATVTVEVSAKLKVPPVPPEPKIQLSSLPRLSERCGWGSVRNNTSVEGSPLKLEGKTYPRGIGAHADALLVYAVPAGMKRFVATVGLDDEKRDDPRASVIFKIFGDVKEMGEKPELLAESPVLSGETTRTWNFDTKLSERHRELRIVIEDAGDGIACDHADLVNAGFLAD